MPCRRLVIPPGMVSQGNRVFLRSLFNLGPGEVCQPEMPNQPESHVVSPTDLDT